MNTLPFLTVFSLIAPPTAQEAMSGIDTAYVKATNQKLASFGTRHSLSDATNPTPAVTRPAHKPSWIAWGARLKTDAYYASPDVFDMQVKAAEYSHPGYVSLRFSVEDAIVKIVSANIAKGVTVEASLPALQTELVNLAKLNGYAVE